MITPLDGECCSPRMTRSFNFRGVFEMIFILKHAGRMSQNEGYVICETKMFGVAPELTGSGNHIVGVSLT